MAFKGILDNQIPESLEINSKFARNFEYNKRREEIQRAKVRAKDLNLYSGSEVSSSESEDSEAELLTKKANSKFLNLISMIKKGDPSLKDPNYKAFSDSDFEESSEGNEKNKEKEKPLRYKDMVRKTLLNPEEDRPETEIQKQKQVKNDFLSAVNQWQEENEDPELFKPRSKHETSKPDLLSIVKETAKDEKDLKRLKDYWSKADNEDDKFLKKFVLEKMWQEPDNELLTYNEIVEQEDENKANEAEKFETAYNFRFEEVGFEKLKTYPRQIDQSVRKKSETRKKERETKKERKDQEKVVRSEEIKRLKNLKKAEIASKLSLIEKLSGTTPAIPTDSFEKDFDPNEHDQIMAQMFDENYYGAEDQPDIDPADIEKVQENDVDVLRIEQTVEIPTAVREGTLQGTWWICDGCDEGIKENSWRFDCQECPNYTLCEICRSKVVHDHRLKRFKVPLGCAPPSNVVKILCDECNKDITREIRFDCGVCEDFSICEQCMDGTKHPHKLKSVQDLWKELEALDYEDMVAGIPCRFKYRDVKARDYGLTVSEILDWEDKKLNKLVSMKKLAPYREDDEVKVTKKKKKFIEKSQDKKRIHQKTSREDTYKV